MNALFRIFFGAPDQDYRGPICSEQEDRRDLRFGFAFLAAIPATAALTLTTSAFAGTCTEQHVRVLG